MINQLKEEFGRLVGDALRDTGRDFSSVTDELKELAAQSMVELALVVGQAGFTHAVMAAADNVAMRIGIDTVQVADRADARIWGVVAGTIGMGARALFAVAP